MPTARVIVNACLVKACLAIVMLHPPAALAEEAPTPTKVSFYFAAHEDDWQLFMTPASFEDVTNDATKTVFVHVTAGDAGLGVSNGGRKHPLYLARENGAEAAIRFMASRDYDAPREKSVARVNFNGHTILRVSYRNTVAYYLRLPDGNPAGGGYERTHFQSLKRLAAGDNDTLAAVDGSTTYRGWGDLVGTVRAILDFERGPAPAITLNVAELDPAINPNDHSDHLMSARAALDAAAGLNCASRAHYVDYASSRLPENLDAQQRDMASSVYAVTVAGVLALDHSIAWRHYDSSYVGRSYSRVEAGNGRCEAPASVLPATPQVAPVRSDKTRQARR